MLVTLALAYNQMDEKKHGVRFRKNIIPSLFFFLISLIFALKLPLWLVDFEGKIWGGEGLFSFIFGKFILCPTFVVLGAGISIVAYCQDDKIERGKVLILGGILYIFVILIILLILSFSFYVILGPPLIN